jgi:hypothetical protein
VSADDEVIGSVQGDYAPPAGTCILKPDWWRLAVVFEHIIVMLQLEGERKLHCVGLSLESEAHLAAGI